VRSPVILTYHQIGSPARDPFKLFVSERNFGEQLAVIARLTPLGLAELGHRLVGGSAPADAVAVTFDDGYVSNLRIAKPALVRAGVPASVFVTTGASGSRREFWWNELAEAIEAAPAGAGGLAIATGEASREWGDGDRNDLLFAVWAWLRTQSGGAVAVGVRAARAWAGLAASAGPADDMRCMTIEELQELTDDGSIEVGAHTRTHPLLSARPREEQVAEIAGSRYDLEQWLGRPVRTFAYPYGRRVSEYRAPAVTAVADAGFDYAVSVGELPLAIRARALELARHVVPNVGGEEFERWLEGRTNPPATRVGLLDRRALRALRERVTPPGRL